MVLENNPDAACMDEIERTEEKEQCTAGNTTPAKLLGEWLYWYRFLYAWQIHFDVFVRLENTTSCINARRRAG